MPETARQDPAAAARRLADPAFWHGLSPTLHLADVDYFVNRPHPALSTEDHARFAAELAHEGYTRFRPDDHGVDIAAMADAVKRLQAEGILTPFAFVYDEFWALFATLRGFLSPLLGDDYRMLPDFWVWHVAPSDEDGGWAPHRDKGAVSLFPDGRPKSLTVWVALTEATPENGCMYLVPADRDPTYGTPQEDRHAFDLADVRALPAAAGTVFCWNQAVLHWGARASRRAVEPRISVAFEFQRADVPPFNEPLLEQPLLPDLRTRLLLIAKQALQYQHMYPLSPEVEAFALAVLGGQPR